MPGAVPPGHFYSPIPSIDEVRKDSDRLFATPSRTLPGIDLREDDQLALLEVFADRYYREMPFGPTQSPAHRFYFENPMFSYADALSLYSVIRHFEPKRVVEVGSGFSSALTLDTNDLFFNGRIRTTFIEPYPDRLMSLLRGTDKDHATVIQNRVQDVGLDLFAELEPNDILFIDSTHVSKIGSDVNRIVFEILPILAKGVLVHFHDIFLPSEYPPQWIYEGCAWNEAYLLRAFLQFNDRFEILLLNNFMGHFHEAFLAERMPLFMKNIGGSVWLRKTA
jgi:predicted O-methyltransferase YrrM